MRFAQARPEITGIFDFEQIREGYRIEDILPLLMFTGRLKTSWHGTDIKNGLQSILKGYRTSVSPKLTPAEEELIPLHLESAFLFAMIARGRRLKQETNEEERRVLIAAIHGAMDTLKVVRETFAEEIEKISSRSETRLPDGQVLSPESGAAVLDGINAEIEDVLRQLHATTLERMKPVVKKVTGKIVDVEFSRELTAAVLGVIESEEGRQAWDHGNLNELRELVQPALGEGLAWLVDEHSDPDARPIRLTGRIAADTSAESLIALVTLISKPEDRFYLLMEDADAAAAGAFETALHQRIEAIGVLPVIADQIQVLAANGGEQEVVRAARKIAGQKNGGGIPGIADADGAFLDEIGHIAAHLLQTPAELKESIAEFFLAAAYLRSAPQDAEAGMSRAHLDEWMRQHGISPEAYGERVAALVQMMQSSRVVRTYA